MAYFKVNIQAEIEIEINQTFSKILQIIRQTFGDGIVGWKIDRLGHLDRQQNPSHSAALGVGHVVRVLQVGKLRR